MIKFPFKARIKDKKDCHHEDRRDLSDKYFGKIITVKSQSMWAIYSDDLPFSINEESITILDYKKPLEELNQQLGKMKGHTGSLRDYQTILDISRELYESDNTLTDKQLKTCRTIWEKYNKNEQKKT